MKLDKIKFAKLIHFIGIRLNINFLNDEFIADLDAMIDIEPSEVQHNYPAASDINQLMFLIAQGGQKIEAIKLHRKLTGWGLKESKDEVEKIWLDNRLINQIKDALGTEENGFALVEVARNAHRAERELASHTNFDNKD